MRTQRADPAAILDLGPQSDIEAQSLLRHAHDTSLVELMLAAADLVGEESIL